MRTTGLLEAKFQARLITFWEGLGWTVVRLLRTSKGGMPDVLLLHPARPTRFVEVKRAGERPRPVQEYRHQELRRLGFDVRVVSAGDWPLDPGEWS